MRRKLTILAVVLLPLLLACGSGREEPAGQEVAAAALDTAALALEQPAEPAQRLPAQRMWDTADSSSFDVEEINRSGREIEDSLQWLRENPPPMTYEDTLDMLKKIRPDCNGAYSYLKPSDFPGLPEEIAEWLEERGYVIPQNLPPVFQYMDRDNLPINAIKDEFIRSGQTDWAVYCTNWKNTQIFVFQNSKTDTVLTTDSISEDIGLECCWYTIGSMKGQFIKEDYVLRKDQKIQHIDNISHHGIVLGAHEHFMVLLYYQDGQWLLFSSTSDC